MQPPRYDLLLFTWSLPLSLGLGGTLAALAYGVYAYKNRGPMSTSRYLMRLRVIAQGAVVGAMILGATVSSMKTPSKKE